VISEVPCVNPAGADTALKSAMNGSLLNINLCTSEPNQIVLNEACFTENSLIYPEQQTAGWRFQIYQNSGAYDWNSLVNPSSADCRSTVK
jgi:hypothetical protein